MSRITVAAIQLNGQPGAEDNLRLLEPLLAAAREAGATMAVLPENLLCMGQRDGDKFEAADRAPDWLWRDRVLALGARHGLGLVAGSLYCHPDPAQTERVLARCWLSDRGGAIAGHYDKRHLFDVEAASGESYHESRTIAPGDNPPIVLSCEQLRWGLSICYDLRFAEHYLALALAGAQIITVPAAFTHTTGQAHWEPLLRARAIETQCFVIAANQCGRHASGRQTWGHSMIIDPWGRVLAQAGHEPGIITAELDLGLQRELQQRFPVHSHRRPTELTGAQDSAGAP